MKLSLGIVLLLATTSSMWAQASTARMYQHMQELGTSARVLYIAAHPDDENTRLLSYLSQELHFKTAYLSLTRGDGGQNLIGRETEEALGLIRTRELLEARRVDGATQFFSRAYDFGFSKNPEETFRFWNRDSVLHDVVWVIRQFRPDVIITRFPTTGEGGHGHHTASAMLAVEAFKAAADPKKFPKQLAYFPVWQAKRLYWNNFMPSRDAATNTSNMLKMDVGAFNPVLGESMGEVAARSRSMHKSQGFGVKAQRGEILEYFTYLAGDSAKQSLFDGIATSLLRYGEAGQKLQSLQLELIQNYQPGSPEASIPRLVLFYQQLDALSDTLVRNEKRRAVEDLLLELAGVHQEYLAQRYEYVPGDTLTATYQFIYRKGNMVTLNALKLPEMTEPVKFHEKLSRNQTTERRIQLQIPSNMPASSPYWLQLPHGEGAFVHPSWTMTGMPEGEPVLWAESEIGVNGIRIKRKLPMQYKWVDPVKGELLRRVEVVPELVAEVQQSVIQLDGSRTSATVPVQIRFPSGARKGTLRWNLSEATGLRVFPAELALDSLRSGQVLEFRFEHQPSRNDKDARRSTVFLEYAAEGSKTYRAVQHTHRVQYDHIPIQTWHDKAALTVVQAKVDRKVQQLGYVEGAGDGVAEALKGAGFTVRVLDNDAIRLLDPQQTPAVVVGIRALNSREEMALWMPLLLEYTRKGGTLILQYNTRNWISDVKVQPGPFPFEISRNRVTDEGAPVTLLEPDHPLFQFPNKIESTDFEGWVQERGLYFCEKTDARYQDLLQMNDPGEAPLKGCLLYVPYGDGHFVYTGLSFFRQLPAGVPGAFRLFSNMLSAGAAHGKE